MILPSLVITKEVGVDCGNKLKITFWISIGFPFRRSLAKTLPTVVAVSSCARGSSNSVGVV